MGILKKPEPKADETTENVLAEAPAPSSPSQEKSPLAEASGPKKKTRPKPRALVEDGESFYRRKKKIDREKAISLAMSYDRDLETRQIAYDGDVLLKIELFKRRFGLRGLSMGRVVENILAKDPRIFSARVLKEAITTEETSMAKGLWTYADEIKEKSPEGTTDSDVLNAIIRHILKDLDS